MEPRRSLSRHRRAGTEGATSTRAGDDADAFETRWKGKLAAEAGKGAAGGLGKALRDYEALEELIGRIISYAGLVYAGDTTDPQRAKFYGDVQEKMTDASAHLLFFALELNLIDDALLDDGAGRRSAVRPLPAVDRSICARTSPTSSTTASSSSSTRSR